MRNHCDIKIAAKSGSRGMLVNGVIEALGTFKNLLHVFTADFSVL
jgi:hypothetical protein